MDWKRQLDVNIPDRRQVPIPNQQRREFIFRLAELHVEPSPHMLLHLVDELSQYQLPERLQDSLTSIRHDIQEQPSDKTLKHICNYLIGQLESMIGTGMKNQCHTIETMEGCGSKLDTLRLKAVERVLKHLSDQLPTAVGVRKAKIQKEISLYNKQKEHLQQRMTGGAVAPIFVSKKYPKDYSDDVTDILSAMSFADGLKVLGSMSLRSQPFAGDYDAYEVVNKEGPVAKAVVELRKRFQQMIQRLSKMDNTYIGDIKSGSVEEWRVLKKDVMVSNGVVVNYDYKGSKATVQRLASEGIITKEEAKKANAVLKEKMSPTDYFAARDVLKFHVLRWKPKNVIENSLTLRDGSKITLEEAFQCPTITKMDVIGWVQDNRYTDFSCLYEFRVDGKGINPDPIDIIPSLKADIAYYMSAGKPFKALKRQFALAKVEGDVKTATKLQPILNSDLGRLYFITGDFGTLVSLLEHPKTPTSDLKFEIDQFKSRMANIWELKEFLKDEGQIVKELDRIMALPKSKMAKPLEALGDRLNSILQSATWKVLGQSRKSGHKKGDLRTEYDVAEEDEDEYV